MSIFKKIISHSSGNPVLHHNTSNGDIVNNNGTPVANYKDGVVRDRLGNDRMYIQSNGEVIDHNGDRVGFVDGYGVLRDRMGNEIAHEE